MENNSLLKQIIKPSLHPRLNTRSIPNFLSKKFDSNTQHQADIWSGKTYHVNPKTHVFTTIQEHFGNRIIKSFDLPKDAVVVDIGCFIGEKLWQLNKKKSYLGVGIDIAVPALKAAQKIDIYGHKFIAADMERLPFKNNSVDLVMVFDVIEHLTHAERGFAEVARILKPGGRFLLHIPIKNNKWSMFWWKQKLFPKLAKKDYDDVGHAPSRMLTSYQINKYLIKYGLKPERKIYYNSFFVHFWDREFVKIASSLLMKRSDINDSRKQKRAVDDGNLGKIRSVYGKYIIPFFELLSFPDLILSKMGIGNTYFVLSTKD